MARINLLPWREERRKLRNREAQTLLGATAVAAVLAVLLIVFQYGRLIDGQLARNRMLEQEIAAVDRKIKEVEEFEKERSRLLSRKQIIEQLQSSRSMMVHLFDDLVRTIPEGVRLNSIKQAGDQLTLEGAAESNARVSEYMRKLEVSDWMGNPDLQIVEAKGADKRSRYMFTLRVNLKKPTVEGEEGQEGDPAAATAATGGAAP
ncbi:MAG: PilN domain-containing protein [Xanthomonadaceae bacterium]|jgi:type IV pilus assembly protein PilN|nr:PilN domain-containing protein [Xanthomonadaceae bacterium]